MGIEKIPVVFTPDENFVVQTAVAILSMLETKEETTQYDFYIVVSEQMKVENLAILERIRKIHLEFQYRIVFIETVRLDCQKVTARHLSTSAYYRLVLADVLKEDKCMYHDGDILVLEDLQEMFHRNVQDVYVAGIKAIAKMQPTEENYNVMKKWNWQSFEQYILSGDLIFNLKKIREDGLVEKFYEQMEKEFPSEDQDVINYCCYGKIDFLPLKFCVMNRWFCPNAFASMSRMVYGKEELEEALKRPAVVHFAGADTKPWVNLRASYGRMWWKYAERILDLNEYQKWYERAKEYTLRRDWKHFIGQLPKDKKVIIFGFSKISRQLFDAMKKHGIMVSCSADNNSKVWGEVYENCGVMGIESALESDSDCMVVIASQNFREDIRKQLGKLGIPDEQMVDFYNKSYIYYMSIAPECYGDELADVYFREYGMDLTPIDAQKELEKLSIEECNELKEKYFMKYWMMP